MLTIQERRQLRTFGWANGFMNVGFIAGRMRRDPKNHRLIHIQQTPAVEQSIPVLLGKDYILSETGFPDGTYVSILARVRGFNNETKNAAVMEALHVGYMNASEVDVDVHMNRLYGMLKTLPSDVQAEAQASGLKSHDVQQPDELKQFDGVQQVTALESGDQQEPGGIRNKKEAMLRNANRVQIAGVIGFMEFREGSPDGGKSQSARLQIWVQQNANSSDAIPVRLYGRLAAEAIQRLRIGVPVYVDGNILVDVKRIEREGAPHELDKTPYIKAYSHDLAQQMHVKTLHPWMEELERVGRTDKGMAERTEFIPYKPKTDGQTTKE